MAVGSWAAGALYDHFGTYGPAFAAGVAANAVNLVIVGLLVFRQRQRASRFA
jgi:cyanate permease